MKRRGHRISGCQWYDILGRMGEATMQGGTIAKINWSENTTLIFKAVGINVGL